MGKSLPSTSRFQDFARIITSDRIRRPKHIKPVARPLPNPRIDPPTEPTKALPGGVRVESEQLNLSLKKMEANSSMEKRNRRTPLAEVVSDCVSRWFEDTLKEAKAGDTGMQVLVGQMYCSGYGVTRDARKGRHWLNKASQTRSCVWNVSDKQPGYNESDSDSDDNKAGDK